MLKTSTIHYFGGAFAFDAHNDVMVESAVSLSVMLYDANWQLFFFVERNYEFLMIMLIEIYYSAYKIKNPYTFSSA